MAVSFRTMHPFDSLQRAATARGKTVGELNEDIVKDCKWEDVFETPLELPDFESEDVSTGDKSEQAKRSGGKKKRGGIFTECSLSDAS